MKKIFGWILFLGVCIGCSPATGDPVKVVTTTSHLTDLVRTIGGDDIAVFGLMGPGVDPHLYKASENDVRKLSQAKMIIYNGLFLESKMTKVFEKMSRLKKVFEAGSVLDKKDLLASEDYPDQFDPHVWFDVDLWIQIAEEVGNQLAELDLNNESKYIKRSGQYITQLKSLKQEMLEKVSELPKEKRVLITAHDAFRYFGKAFGFEVHGLQGMSTESEAGTKDVIALADFIVEKKVKAIFIESSIPERNIKAVVDAVQARGWDVKIGGELFSDAMGDEGTPEGTYIGMLRHNVETIVNALR